MMMMVNPVHSIPTLLPVSPVSLGWNPRLAHDCSRLRHLRSDLQGQRGRDADGHSGAKVLLVQFVDWPAESYSRRYPLRRCRFTTPPFSEFFAAHGCVAWPDWASTRQLSVQFLRRRGLDPGTWRGWLEPCWIVWGGRRRRRRRRRSVGHGLSHHLRGRLLHPLQDGDSLKYRVRV